MDDTKEVDGVIHDMDAEILTILNIRSTLEKASGISTAEASASDQEIMEGLDHGLRLRQQWCERINAVLGTNFSVRLADSAVIEQPDVSGDNTEDEKEEDDGTADQ